MSLNLSNTQIAKELSLTESDCHAMTSLRGEGVYEKHPQEQLEGAIEFDELYLIAGHKSKSDAVKKRRKARRRCLKGKRGGGIASQDINSM